MLKKVMLPMVEEMSCGECSACCVSFSLVPDRKFWPKGKKVGVPCKYLGKGCTIHDQPRPEVCTDFRCAWRAGKFGPDVAWRPDKSGLIMFPNTLLRLFQGTLRSLQEQGRFQRWTDEDAGIGIVETRPRALVDCDLGALRQRLEKLSYYYRIVVVVPHGIDLIYDRPLHLRSVHEQVVVVWRDIPDYAVEVAAWWDQVPVMLPLVG